MSIGYVQYMDDLAGDLQVLPDIKGMLEDPRKWTLAFKVLFGPTVIWQWFLNGEDSHPDAASMISAL